MSWGQGWKGLGAPPVSPDWPASSRGSHMAGPMPAWSWGQRDPEALAGHPHPPPHVQPRSCWTEPGGLGWAPPERQAPLWAAPPGVRSASDREVLSARLLHWGRLWRGGLPSTAEPCLQHGGLRGTRGVLAHLALGSGHLALLPPGEPLVPIGAAWAGCGRQHHAAHPFALTHHTHEGPALTLLGGTHAQGDLRVTCEDSTQPGHLLTGAVERLSGFLRGQHRPSGLRTPSLHSRPSSAVSSGR